MKLLIKTIITIFLICMFGYAFCIGAEREVRRQEIVRQDICEKYELSCSG